MAGITIQIDLGDLIGGGRGYREPRGPDAVEPTYLPTVPADYNSLEGFNNQKVWWKEYKKSPIKWVRIEGRGSTATECTDIIFRMSPGNTDQLEDEEMCEHSGYGTVAYADYPENMHIQAEHLRQLEDMGYEEGDDNLTILAE